MVLNQTAHCFSSLFFLCYMLALEQGEGPSPVPDPVIVLDSTFD